VIGKGLAEGRSSANAVGSAVYNLVAASIATNDDSIPPQWFSRWVQQQSVPKSTEPVVAQSSAVWIKAEIEKMQAANQIPSNATRRALGKNLVERMKQAKARGEVSVAMKVRSIENLLSANGLWPLVTPKHNSSITRT
jgi:hypothetical protein